MAMKKFDDEKIIFEKLRWGGGVSNLAMFKQLHIVGGIL